MSDSLRFKGADVMIFINHPRDKTKLDDTPGRIYSCLLMKA
jgi:hypothetical protein